MHLRSWCSRRTTNTLMMMMMMMMYLSGAKYMMVNDSSAQFAYGTKQFWLTWKVHLQYLPCSSDPPSWVLGRRWECELTRALLHPYPEARPPSGHPGHRRSADGDRQPPEQSRSSTRRTDLERDEDLERWWVEWGGEQRDQDEMVCGTYQRRSHNVFLPVVWRIRTARCAATQHENWQQTSTWK